MGKISTSNLNSDRAYLIYSIILLVIAILVVLSPSIMAKNDFVFQIIAALIAAIVTVIVTRLMLNKQTESNIKVINTQSQQEDVRAYNVEIIKDRINYAHLYLNVIGTVITNQTFTVEDKRKIELYQNHILLNAICTDDNLLVENVCNLSYYTNKVIQSVCDGKDTYHHDLIMVTNYLFRGLYGYNFLLDKNYATSELIKNLEEMDELSMKHSNKS